MYPENLPSPVRRWSSPLPDYSHMTGDVVGYHACPTCSRTVTEIFRPGRARVYCSNSCRQRAYRWRRARGIRLCVQRNGPAERSLANGRRHALRDERDPSAVLADRRRRLLTACGTFAKPAREGRYTHNDFLPYHPWSCATCVALVGAGPPPDE